MIEINIKKKLHFSEGEGLLEINEKIEDGEFIVLYGPSGVGKTTILRILSGLTNPDEGRVVVDDQVWFDQIDKINLPPQKRSIGFVFQDFALFPNMTIEENLRYAQGDKNNELLKKIIS